MMLAHVDIRAGGKRTLSGVINVLVLWALVLGFGGLATSIALAVLLKAGIDIIGGYLKRIRTASRAGMLVTMPTTAFMDLFTGPLGWGSHGLLVISFAIFTSADEICQARVPSRGWS
jgi:hypothetical protein